MERAAPCLLYDVGFGYPCAARQDCHISSGPLLIRACRSGPIQPSPVTPWLQGKIPALSCSPVVLAITCLVGLRSPPEGHRLCAGLDWPDVLLLGTPTFADRAVSRLLVRPIKIVVGSVWHKNLVAYVCRGRTTLLRGRSAVCV